MTFREAWDLRVKKNWELVERQLDNPEVFEHYRVFLNPNMDIIKAISETYVWADMYDVLTGILGLEWMDEAFHDPDLADRIKSDLDWWIVTYELTEKFGMADIILALDMYLDGMFDDEGMDSIGRMEDYELC